MMKTASSIRLAVYMIAGVVAAQVVLMYATDKTVGQVVATIVDASVGAYLFWIYTRMRNY